MMPLGSGFDPFRRILSFSAALSLCACASTPPTPVEPTAKIDSPVEASSKAPATDGPSFVLRGARVMTGAGDILEKGDVFVEHGLISAVGENLDVPEGVRVIELAGKVVTPGLIDTHSHVGVYASPNLKAHSDGNEAVSPNTAYAQAGDGYWPQDPQIDTARAGGVTTAQILPGSANLIGGRTITVKFRPEARSIHDVRFPGAPGGLKMACGENPKRVYGKKGGPQTRMGNLAGHRRAFQEALEYKRSWEQYEEKLRAWEKEQSRKAASDSQEKSDKKSQKKPSPPARNFGKETLAKVIDGELLVHNHCYRADEMSLMMELAAEYGFTIRNFHHAVEAYKIADRLAEAGTGASVWADWWGFKAEAYDGIRENAAMLSAAGVYTVIHSDSAEGIQRLNQEAAKAMHAGRRVGIEISEEEALRWITLNPAWSLGIDHLTGSLDAGKMADIVVWDRAPFSVYAKAEQVYIDGELVYDRDDPTHQPHSDFGLGLIPEQRGER